MISLTVRAEGLVDLSDEIQEAAKPQLLELMDGATDLFYQDVQRRLSVKAGTFGPLREGLERGDAVAGEAPREITGELKRAVKKSRSVAKRSYVLGGLYTSHPGAALLEYGGIVLRKVKGNVSKRRAKSDLRAAGETGRKAHPVFRPSMLAMETKIQRFFEGSFR